jgi:hypothetical protein
LREEVYELDVDALERGEERAIRLFSVTTRSVRVERLQARSGNPHAVFRVDECESVAYQHDLDLRPETVGPDPRVAHTLHLTYDEVGHPLQQVFLANERGGPGRHVHDANSRQPLDDLMLIWLIFASKDVNEIATRRQMLRRLGHVDVLAAAIDAAYGGERRRVVADHGYALRH